MDNRREAVIRILQFPLALSPRLLFRLVALLFPVVAMMVAVLRLVEDRVRSADVLSIDDYESAFDDGRRRGQELRMPQDVRKGLLRAFTTEAEMIQARTEARKIQSQRNMSRALEDFEKITNLFEAASRKYKKWQRRRKGAQPEPAEVWVQHYKASKQGPSLRSNSWHASSIKERSHTASGDSNRLRSSTGAVLLSSA